MVRLYLIRHGQQSSKLCNVNVPLSEVGREQARLLGERLKGYGITRLYSSDLIRAMETAEIIGAATGLTNQVVANIEELHFGGFQGLSDAQIDERYGELRTAMNTMTEDLHYPDGENAQEVYNRAYPVLLRIVKDAQEAGEEQICIVAHGLEIRCLLSGIFDGCYPKKYLFSKELENCSITELLYDERYERFSLERLNDFAHLEPYPALRRNRWKSGD